MNQAITTRKQQLHMYALKLIYCLIVKYLRKASGDCSSVLLFGKLFHSLRLLGKNFSGTYSRAHWVDETVFMELTGWKLCWQDIS